MQKCLVDCEVSEVRGLFHRALFVGLMYWFGALAMTSSTLAKESVTLAVGHWPPYINQARPGEGVLTRKVLAVYKSMGIQADLLFDGWVQVNDTHLHKPNFVSYGWVKNEQRLSLWHYSEPIGEIVAGLWVRNDFNQMITDYSQLNEYLIGVGKGYSYGQQFEDNKHRLKRADFVEEGEGFRLLIEGRIDVFIGDRLVGEYFLSRHKNWQELVYFQESPILEKTTLHLVCAKTDVECLEHIRHFNRAMQRHNAKEVSHR